MTNDILLADDETTFRETLAQVLRDESLRVTTAADGTEALAHIAERPFAVAILDIQMPGADGIRVLQEIRRHRPQTRVIIITAFGTVERAVEAIKLGAADYVVKPVIFDDILVKIRQHLHFAALEDENRELKQALSDRFDVEQIIGEASSIRLVKDMIRKVAQTRSSVLVTGESGTGKELVARAIHGLSAQCDQRFVAVNCGAIPETLMESELFGHRKGSFTSAVADKKGLFECARNGTLFLDEIGFMPTNCQVKLLRAVEERRVLPVGATDPIALNLRLIAATNRDLEQEIKAGHFREDLYYRINVVGIHLAPLRERPEDIPLLIDHFVRQYSGELGKPCAGVTDEALAVLMAHDWKGNVRELENVIERSLIFAEDERIGVGDLGLTDRHGARVNGEDDNLHDSLKACERQHILRVLRKFGGDKGAAAKALGVGLSSLYRKIDELGIKAPKNLHS